MVLPHTEIGAFSKFLVGGFVALFIHWFIIHKTIYYAGMGLQKCTCILMEEKTIPNILGIRSVYGCVYKLWMAQFIFQPNAKFRANKNGLFWNQQHVGEGGNGINKHILCTHFLPQSEISSWRTCRWALCTLKNSNSLHLPAHCYQYYLWMYLHCIALLIHFWLRKELKSTFFTVYKWGGGSPDHLPPPIPPIVVSGRQKNGSEQTPIHTLTGHKMSYLALNFRRLGNWTPSPL